MSTSYKDAGVDWKKGENFVRQIQKSLSSTCGEEVLQGIGSYAALYSIGNGRYLASSVDGVGTKLLVAKALNKYDTIGIDLVAMCVNDLICTGAKPIFFLDYIVCEKLDVYVAKEIIHGISQACSGIRVAVVGGETAEHPGAFPQDEYDIAGFSVGIVEAKNIIDGKNIKEGDSLVSLASSGMHSNGFSLLRKLVKPEEKELLLEALRPTKIYVNSILNAREKINIKGLAHITGSAFNKIHRINPSFGYRIDNLPRAPSIFKELQKRSRLSDKEMYSTFNMGLGMLVVTDQGKELVEFFNKNGEDAHICGVITKEQSRVTVEDKKTKFILEGP